MIVKNGVIQYKNYNIPVRSIEDYVYNNDELLLNASMKDLSEIFVFGIPANFKEYLLKKVRLYDASSKVNSFKYNGKEYWLDKLQRGSILNLLNTPVATAADTGSMDIILGDDIYSIKPEKLADLINSLEQYAYKCKVTTQKHINEINNYRDPTNPEEYDKFIDFIVNYDYTSGYPEKIEL